MEGKPQRLLQVTFSAEPTVCSAVTITTAIPAATMQYSKAVALTKREIKLFIELSYGVAAGFPVPCAAEHYDCPPQAAIHLNGVS